MLLSLLTRYGLIALFGLILCESAGLPLPGETALLIAAAGAARGLFSIWFVVLVAATAAICGDSLGYWAGARFGLPLLARYGRPLHVTPARLDSAKALMARHGAKAVFFGRFVALLRVFAAFLAGIAHMPYRRFLAYNALGGVTWALLIGALGYTFGSQLPTIERWFGQLGWGVAGAAAAAALVLLLARRQEAGKPVRRWGRRHPRVVGALAVSVLACALFGQLADSVVDHETLAQVDVVLANHIHTLVPAMLVAVALRVTDLGSLGVATLGIAVAAWLAWRRRLWQLGFWVLALGGGEALNLLLKALFQRPRPVFAAAMGETDWGFPSGHAMASLVAYGALALLLARAYPHTRAGIFVGAAVLIALIGASRLVLDVHYLTDVVAGYAAGLAWLALCSGVLDLCVEQGTVASSRR